MESEIAEILLSAAVCGTLPYALTAAAEWLREQRVMHRNGSGAPIR